MTSQHDRATHDSVVHVSHSWAGRCREEEYGAHERHPEDGDRGTGPAEATEVERAWGEVVAPEEPRRDGDGIGWWRVLSETVLLGIRDKTHRRIAQLWTWQRWR